MDDAKALETLQKLREQYDGDMKAMETLIVPKVDITPAEDDLKNLQSAMAGLVPDAATDGTDIGDELASGVQEGVSRAEGYISQLEADMAAAGLGRSACRPAWLSAPGAAGGVQENVGIGAGAMDTLGATGVPHTLTETGSSCPTLRARASPRPRWAATSRRRFSRP